MDIVNNPIVIGVVACVLTYVYLSWRAKQAMKQQKSKKPKDVNLLIPLVVGLIAWFVVYGYIEYNKKPVLDNNPIRPVSQPLPIAPNANYRFTKDVIPDSSSEIKSFSLLTGGVNIPTKPLPDVLIDML
jgi:uncharacterized protein with PQ loop repeat